MIQRQLGGVLDGDDTLVVRHEGSQCVQQRGLAGAGAAGDEDVAAAAYQCVQQGVHRLVERTACEQFVGRERVFAELADRHHRAIDGQRRNDGVESAAVGQARIDHRVGVVKATAERRDDATQDAQQVAVIAEALGGAAQLSAAGNVHVLVTVDEDVLDLRVMQQIIQRAEAGQLLVQCVGDRFHFLRVDRDLPFLDERSGLALNIFAGGFGRPRVDIDALILDMIEQVFMRRRQHALELLGLLERHADGRLGRQWRNRGARG
ncbi:hypothetical protein D3C71_957220 [compost metagenome]